MQSEQIAKLHEEYARVVRMCAGTNVTPNECIKCCGFRWEKGDDFSYMAHMIVIGGNHNNIAAQYEFALAIIEDKPVFKGDVLYDNHGNKWKIMHDGISHLLMERNQKCGAVSLFDGYGSLSWNPPKPKESPSPKFEIGEEVMVDCGQLNGGRKAALVVGTDVGLNSEYIRLYDVIFYHKMLFLMPKRIRVLESQLSKIDIKPKPETITITLDRKMVEQIVKMEGCLFSEISTLMEKLMAAFKAALKSK